MESNALESHLYGDPMKILEAKQSRAARQAEKPKRPTLSLKPRDGGWSEARKRAEELFDFPAAASR